MRKCSSDFITMAWYLTDLSLSMRLPAELTRQKYIALRCAGFNNVDLKTATELRIKVARVPSYSPEAVAEFAVGMIMTVVRKYHKSFCRVREGNFLLDGLLGFNLVGKTVGIVGTGQIGLITGRILSKGFRCNVIGYDPYPSDKAKDHGVNYVNTLEDLLKQSDIISLHCPLVDTTKYMINDNTLAQMKKGVVLINTSRGGLIDTNALIRFVRSTFILSCRPGNNHQQCSQIWPHGSGRPGCLRGRGSVFLHRLKPQDHPG
jgi:lactate dehydrogenase-like 2-hydroxyacid dehydrogenase